MENIHLNEPINLVKNVPQLVLKADGMYQSTNKGVYTVTELLSKFEKGYNVPNMVQGNGLELKFNLKELVPYYMILSAVSFFKDVQKIYKHTAYTYLFHKENLSTDELITELTTELGLDDYTVLSKYLQHGDYFMYVPIQNNMNDMVLNYLLESKDINIVCKMESVLDNYENVEYQTLNDFKQGIPLLIVNVDNDIHLGISVNNYSKFIDVEEFIAIPYVEVTSDEEYTNNYLYTKETYGKRIPYIPSIYDKEWLGLVVDEEEDHSDYDSSVISDNTLNKPCPIEVDEQENVNGDCTNDNSTQLSLLNELNFQNKYDRNDFLEEVGILLDTFTDEERDNSTIHLNNKIINKFNSNKHVQNLALLDNKKNFSELDKVTKSRFEKELRQRIISSLNTCLKDEGYFNEKEYLSKVNVYMGIYESEDNILEYVIITEHQQTGKKHHFTTTQQLDDLINYNIHYVFYKYGVEFNLNKLYYL